jgi:hypothetical protein
MSAAQSSLTVQVPLRIRRRPGWKTVVSPNGVATPAQPTVATQPRGDPVLVKALARAFRYQRMLDKGQYGSITEMAEAERLDRGYMGRLLQLTLLAPGVVEAVLNEQLLQELDLARLLDLPSVDWQEQELLTSVGRL